MAARRSTEGGADTRTAILDAAMVLFGRYGYRRTAMDEVARAAGIAKGTIYLYFETKEALFRALSAAAADHILATSRAAAAAAAGPVADRRVAVLDAKFGWVHEAVQRSPHAAELLDSTNRLAGERFAAVDVAYREILEGVVAAAARRGALALKAHGLTARDVVDTLLDGAHGMATSAGPDVDAAAFRARLARLVRVALAGVAASEAAPARRAAR